MTLNKLSLLPGFQKFITWGKFHEERRLGYYWYTQSLVRSNVCSGMLRVPDRYNCVWSRKFGRFVLWCWDSVRCSESGTLGQEMRAAALQTVTDSLLHLIHWSSSSTLATLWCHISHIQHRHLVTSFSATRRVVSQKMLIIYKYVINSTTAKLLIDQSSNHLASRYISTSTDIFATGSVAAGAGSGRGLDCKLVVRQNKD